ncbi:MAG: PQQ-binding-like beta-propeller repeat protein [Thaumarchaeota archaeon]|nr:PQQ-binding-like beta-propeller repeat protein [Nitrososphaerota archaeon]
MLSRRYRVTNYTVLVILAFSAFIPALAYAAPLSNSDKDWQRVNGNSWAWNYSPQTQINKNNVKDLEVKWVFPLGSKALSPAAMTSLGMEDGSTAPPIIHNGIAYVTTNFFRTYAIDMKTGKQVWSHDYLINATEAAKLPVIFGSGHSHGVRYWEGGDAILVGGKACDIYAIDAKTGKTKFRIADICKTNIDGQLVSSNFIYRQTLNSVADVGTYEKGRQFVYVLPGYIHSSLRADGAGNGRHTTVGISMDAPYNIIWKVYSSPPYDRLTKDWALQECDIGYFRTNPCTDVAAKNQAGLEWDFALPNQAPSKWAGVTSNWGQPVIDEDTGILYTNTGNQGPYSNMSLAPGPRLYGSTIMAIDMNKGQRAWWLQPFPHDPYDYDCNWSGMLAESSTVGKIYVKGCKEGVLYAMDAKTGKPVWTADVVAEQVSWGQIGASALKTMPEGVKYYRPDPYSSYDMREWNWISYPATKPGDKGKACTLPCTVYPFWSNGLFATDPSYDPETQTVIHYAIGLQVDILKENPYVVGGNLFTTKSYPITNTTIVARDLATGKAKWTWFWPVNQQRSHMVVTGGMVYSGFGDGYVRFLDKDTGKLLHEINVGAAMWVGPTIGADSAGNSKILTLVSGGATGSAGRALSATIIALGLSDRAAAEAKTTTVTTTASTTITSSTTQTVTSTSATTATTTASTTVTTTAISTSATTVATTVTTTAPGQTVTATSATETMGPVTYAAIGIAVIAIVAAAVMMMRKK